VKTAKTVISYDPPRTDLCNPEENYPRPSPSQSIATIESPETQPRRRDEKAWEITLSSGKPATLDIAFVNPTP
jgi:hypothetical protein